MRLVETKPLPMSRERIDRITSRQESFRLGQMPRQDPLNEVYLWHRLLRGAAIDINSGCWIWLRSNTGRYGQISRKKKLIYNHRLMYELAIGPIEKGLFVCHTCDTPLCINPSHLFTGTHSENMADGVRKGRINQGSNNPHSRLNDDNIRDIRRMIRDGVYQHDIAIKYNVARVTISQIHTGKRWAHVK